MLAFALANAFAQAYPNLGIHQFTDEKVREAAAQELLQRVDWHVDPVLEAAWKGGPRPETVDAGLAHARF